MSAASSNTLNPPLICSYPPRQKIYFTYTCPIPSNRTASEEYFVANKHIGRPEREILVLAYGYCNFPKPSVKGFPTFDDPTYRSCRTPYRAWHGYMVTTAYHVEVEVGVTGMRAHPPPWPPPLRRRRALLFLTMCAASRLDTPTSAAQFECI
jgi:hypothetical protein